MQSSHALGRNASSGSGLELPAQKKPTKIAVCWIKSLPLILGSHVHHFFLVVIGPLRCRSDWWLRRFVWHDHGIVFKKGQRQKTRWTEVFVPNLVVSIFHVLPRSTTLPLSYSCQVQAAGLGVAMMMPGSTVLAMGLKPQWFGRSWGRAIFS